MVSQGKLPISLVVITLNEEENLKKCLASADFCSEFIVVDSGSTDGTLTVAASFGARVLHRDWSGYGDQKNYGVDQTTCPWVLCIDADEVVTSELRSSILKAFEFDPTCDGFDINRHGVYADQRINYSGWYPQWRTFLYRKGSAVWGGLEPHVVVHFSGVSKRRLEGDLLHFTYKTISEHIRKNTSSAFAAGEAMFKSGRKHNWLDLLLRPPWAWFKCYVMQRGFLDGFLGLVIANSQAHYTFLKYAFLRERIRSSGRVKNSE